MEHHRFPHPSDAVELFDRAIERLDHSLRTADEPAWEPRLDAALCWAGVIGGAALIAFSVWMLKGG